MKIAFLLLHYPVFSETFVSREILNLQKLNIKGLIICEKHTTKPPFHPHIKQISFPIYQIAPKIIGQDFIKIFFSHLHYIFYHPLAYLKSFLLLLSFFNFHHLRIFIKSPLIAKLLTQNNVDIVYAHEIDSPCLTALICSQLCHIPCGIIIHTQYLFAQNKFLKQKLIYADFIIFQSKYSQNIAKKITKLSEKYFSKCHVLSTPGIDTKFFSPLKNPTLPKQIRLITIGRLEEAKGYPILLKAIKMLKKSFPDILLTIIGDGSQKISLKKYIQQNQLENNIQLTGFIGHTPRLIKLLHQHQYFILPSIIDSQNNHDVHPNVVKEAMSSGLITITSRLGGITEIINNTKNAFLIDRVSPKNLAKIIRKVHLLPLSQKIDIATQARQTILHNHRQELICDQLKQIFEKQIYEK